MGSIILFTLTWTSLSLKQGTTGTGTSLNLYMLMKSFSDKVSSKLRTTCLAISLRTPVIDPDVSTRMIISLGLAAAWRYHGRRRQSNKSGSHSPCPHLVANYFGIEYRTNAENQKSQLYKAGHLILFIRLDESQSLTSFEKGKNDDQLPGYCRINPVELPKYCQVSDGSDS